MTDNATFAGNQKPDSGTSPYNQMEFVVRSLLGRTATASLVQIMAVESGVGVEPVGFVDVKPLVAQLDGKGQAVPHGTIHHVPYLRLQGGVNAVIIDPAVGDIGLAVFSSHDISSVKETKAAGNPGSRRRFSMADALYIGGYLNGTPENYIRFTSSGDIELKPAATVTIVGDLNVTGDATAAGVSLAHHKHTGVQTGTGISGPPQPAP